MVWTFDFSYIHLKNSEKKSGYFFGFFFGFFSGYFSGFFWISFSSFTTFLFRRKNPKKNPDFLKQ